MSGTAITETLQDGELPPAGETPAAEGRDADSQGAPRDAGQSALPSHDEIAARAYELYLARGAGDGQDQDDWLIAERELLGAGSNL
jgi:hypothetical protein